MNKQHAAGELLPMKTERQLKRTKVSTLALKQSNKPQTRRKLDVDIDDEIDEL